jgi:hypothetical protein
MKLANSFIRELPTKARDLKNGIVNTVLGIVNSLITPTSATARPNTN